ncbi:acyl-CoA dehydrogenase [Streptomyces sp. SAS_276]|uniref:acyl-CoA dehydrogenase n=1 Tax=Streptomyces sp. SAS_276 TaxID=3412745 RepID=UPI00403D3AE1
MGQAADAFTAACTQATDPGTHTVLEDLRTLFLLERLAPLSGLLLAEHVLTAEQVRSLPDTLRDLTTRLAPHLAALTEAFDVPEERLASLPMLTAQTS